MVARAYRQTATHKVRNFLAAQGVDVQPWSGLDETYAALYGLLCQRKDDPTLEPNARGGLLLLLAPRPAAHRRIHYTPNHNLESFDGKQRIRFWPQP